MQIDTSLLWLLFIIGLGDALLVGRRMRALAKILVERGYGIIPFELTAFRSFSVEDVFAAWGDDGRRNAVKNIRLDFLFIPGYALAFASLTLLAAGTQAGTFRWIGQLLAAGQLLAGLLDVIENLFLLRLLRDWQSPQGWMVPAASWPALVKIILLLLALLYWLAAVGAWLWGFIF